MGGRKGEVGVKERKKGREKGREKSCSSCKTSHGMGDKREVGDVEVVGGDVGDDFSGEEVSLVLVCVGGEGGGGERLYGWIRVFYVGA